jgi:hypothetical protein
MKVDFGQLGFFPNSASPRLGESHIRIPKSMGYVGHVKFAQAAQIFNYSNKETTEKYFRNVGAGLIPALLALKMRMTCSVRMLTV